MSEQIGMTVLRRVVEHYEKNPGSWTIGAGSLAKVSGESAAAISRALQKPEERGCAHTMIQCYSAIVAGDGKGRAVAERDAIRIVCEHHGQEVDYATIHTFNDDRKDSAEILNYLKAALPDQSAPAPAPEPRAKRRTGSRRELVATVCGLGVFFSVVSGVIA